VRRVIDKEFESTVEDWDDDDDDDDRRRNQRRRGGQEGEDGQPKVRWGEVR
jgi:hypothetical protein